MTFFNLIISNKNIIEYRTSSITLKIKGKGNKNIFSSYFDSRYYPDIIDINGVQQTPNTYTYYCGLDNNNIVKLIWNNAIDNCQSMFRECLDIIEIDLSNFDASKVKYMSTMFYRCSELTSINLQNFDTSNVIGMSSMFAGCSKLNSLDLSHFNTSNVEYMGAMFSSLKLSSLDFI